MSQKHGRYIHVPYYRVAAMQSEQTHTTKDTSLFLGLFATYLGTKKREESSRPKYDQ
jgi:hypothetical protein